MLLWEMLNPVGEDAPAKPCEARTTPALETPVRLPFDTRCSAVTKSGKRCRGKIRPNMDVCVFHDPVVLAKMRRANAARRGDRRRRLSHLPDGYLRKLTNRAAAGHAMDRLYREVRLGLVTPEMGRVLITVLNRMLDNGLCDKDGLAHHSNGRSKAEQIRPKLSKLLTRTERAAWRRAVRNAPASFVRGREARLAQKPEPPKTRQKAPDPSSDTALRVALSAAS